MCHPLGEKGSPGEIRTSPGDPGQKGQKGLLGNPGPEGKTGVTQKKDEANKQIIKKKKKIIVTLFSDHF